MGDKKIIRNVTYEEIGGNFIKIEEIEPEQNFNSENQDVNLVEVPTISKELKEYNSNITIARRSRGRPRKSHNNHKMSDIKIISDEMYVEIDGNFIKIEEMEREQNFNSENQDVNLVEVPIISKESKEYHSNILTARRPRGRPRKSHDNHKMGDEEIICNETYEKIDGNFNKIEEMEREQNFNSENQDVNLVEVPTISKESKEYHSNIITACRPSKSQTTDWLKHTSLDNFRPLQPKLVLPNLSVLKHKFRLPMSMPTMSSNHTIISDQIPNKKARFVTTSTFNKTNNCIKLNSNNNINNSDDNKSNITDSNVDTVNNNIISNSNNSNNNNSDTENLLIFKRKKIDEKTDETAKIEDVKASCNCTNHSNDSNNSNSNDSYSNCSNNSKVLCTKAISKSHKNSTELFFESMTQAVLNLPNEVQADIKMQICQIVTKAEIQHYKSQAKSKTEN